jgi:hypothetical protein
MTVTVNLPPEVEQAYLAEAQAKGVPLSDVVRDVLIARRPSTPKEQTVFAEGLGLFGSPGDAALLDEVVSVAYRERRRPTKPSE